MKEKIITFFHSLILYDYILFGSVFFLFVLFLIITILLQNKLALALLSFLMAFIILLAGPTLGYVELHKYLFKNSIELLQEKKLTYTKAVVVKGRLHNESKFDFESCKITAKVSKHTGNELKDYIFRFKPIQSMSILEHNISQGDTRDFKIIVEPFTYTKGYEVSLGAKCK